MQSKSSSQKIFNNQYLVVKKLSSGSFGVVFLGLDQNTKQEVAIKVEKEENEEVRSLEREVQILKRLDGAEGFPKYLWSGEDQGYNVLVIQLLGKDLAHHFKVLKKFTLKTVLNIGIQSVLDLERSHIKGVVHRDLKPENMILGLGKEIHKLYLIDFGISKIYRDSNNRHIPFKDQKSFLGTTRYASIAAHKGYELGRKDDLESLMYILLYFLRGSLPWQNMMNVTDDERTKKVGDMKVAMEGEIFKDQPNELQRIFDYIRKLQFKHEPNYKMIIQEFKKAAETNKINLDGTFDWSEIKQSTHHTNYQTDSYQNMSRNMIQPANSNEMKKSIEKQLSGLIQQGSNNLLAPPPISSRNNFSRDDIRKYSNITMNSIIKGTMHSINPIYQASICDENNPNISSSNQNIQDSDNRFDFEENIISDLNSEEMKENEKKEVTLFQKYQKIKKGIPFHFMPQTKSLKKNINNK